MGTYSKNYIRHSIPHRYNFVKKYVDKLDFISKWVLIPKIISGTQFPTDSQSFEYLQRLKKERNDLIHFKTKKNVVGEEEYMLLLDESLLTPDECFRYISKILDTLAQIDTHDWIVLDWWFIRKLRSNEYQVFAENFFKELRGKI